MSERTIDWVFRATDKTGAAFRSVDSKLAGITKSLRTFAGFAGFAAVAAGIGTLTRDVVNLGSELQDASDKLGVNAESLQFLKYAAEQTGSSFGTLQTALAFNAKLVGNAARGNKEAADSLKLLGIGAKEFIGVPLDKRLAVIATKLASIQDPAERLELALKLLGRGSADLLPLLSQGADGLSKFETEARSLGLFLSKEQVKQLDDAGDAWDRLNLKIKVFSAGPLTGTIGFLTGIGDAITDLQDRIDDLDVSKLEEFQKLSEGPKGPQGRRVTTAFDKAMASFGEGSFKLSNEGQTVDDRLYLMMNEAKRIGEEQELAAKAAVKAQELLSAAAAKTAEEVKSVTEDIAKLSKEANSYFEDRGKELTEKYKPAIDILAEGVDEVNRLFIAGVISSETAAAAIKDYSASYVDSFDRVIEKNTEVSDSTTDLLKQIQVAANGFARDLTDTFFDATQTIGELFEQLAITIAKAIFTQTVTEPFINSILGSIKLPGSSSSPGGTSSGGNAPESFFRRAIGGSVMAGSSYLVGERGPELFVPSGGGTIVPNGGSSPVTVNFTITSVDPQTAAQTIASQERLITGMIRRATLRAGRRPQLA